jgi:signal transduction histidine kinase
VELRNEVPRGQSVRADAAQMRQALLNLGLNAVAAIDGSGLVRVGAHREELGSFLARMSPARRERQAGGAGTGGRPGLTLSVSDNGCGMDEATLGRAGEPFFTTRPGGTGLGLAIVERFAAAHGGATLLVSRPGRGTTVEVWLPERAEAIADG